MLLLVLVVVALVICLIRGEGLVWIAGLGEQPAQAVEPRALPGVPGLAARLAAERVADGGGDVVDPGGGN